jgi:secreted PhoX family phosphatase
MTLHRRHFMLRAGAFALGFSGLRAMAARARLCPSDPWARYGPLIPDPAGVFDLPEGFSYSILSRAGDVMDDGLIVPARHDGMAAFPGADGLTILVRNHEIQHSDKVVGPFGADNKLLDRVPPAKLFDRGNGTRPCRGGTTTVVYDTRTGRVVRQFLSLAGTDRNCAGGPTPRGTWITCEESVLRGGAGQEQEHDHGWAFEVPATVEIGLADPRPIRAMGRYYREACCTDPRTGIVYQSEDLADGLLYRYLPDKPDDLHAGGRLQALAVRGRPRLDTGNRPSPAVVPGERLPTEWIDLRDVESPEGDLRKRGFEAGAARFRRAEGMWWAHDAVYFCCTEGGAAGRGQLFRYTPSPHEGAAGENEHPGIIELWVEADSGSVMRNPDNITAAPWGDLIVCEDGPGTDHLLGVTRGGEVYRLGMNRKSPGELAGACFSPDGSTLFVNMQEESQTLAIRGPWGR